MKTLPTLLPLIALLAVSACQTVEGAGKDLQSAGTAIARESRQAAN
ncbi:MAG: entericidin A/B family lipoprotein [Rhodobacteraceae bacterium]|jgi:predicted small secreted protein|nr:entericidin A/B family lipoprotein [Paracoccaceae bacterium]